MVPQSRNPLPDDWPQKLDNLLALPGEVRVRDTVGDRDARPAHESLDGLHDTANEHLELHGVGLALVVQGLQHGAVEALEVGQDQNADGLGPARRGDAADRAEQHGGQARRVEEVLEAGARELGPQQRVGRAVLARHHLQQARGQLPQAVLLPQRVRSLVGCGPAQLARHEAREHGGRQRAGVRVEEEVGVLDDRLGKFHHLAQYEQVIEVVRHLVGDEVDKVWEELMQAGIGADRFEGSFAESRLFLIRVVVKYGGLDLVEVQDQLFADYMLDRGPERDVVVARERCQGRVRARPLGQEVFGRSLSSGWVLGDGRLDTLDGKPMSCDEAS